MPSEFGPRASRGPPPPAPSAGYPRRRRLPAAPVGAPEQGASAIAASAWKHSRVIDQPVAVARPASGAPSPPRPPPPPGAPPGVTPRSPWQSGLLGLPKPPPWAVTQVAPALAPTSKAAPAPAPVTKAAPALELTSKAAPAPAQDTQAAPAPEPVTTAASAPATVTKAAPAPAPPPAPTPPAQPDTSAAAPRAAQVAPTPALGLSAPALGEAAALPAGPPAAACAPPAAPPAGPLQQAPPGEALLAATVHERWGEALEFIEACALRARFCFWFGSRPGGAWAEKTCGREHCNISCEINNTYKCGRPLPWRAPARTPAAPPPGPSPGRTISGASVVLPLCAGLALVLDLYLM